MIRTAESFEISAVEALDSAHESDLVHLVLKGDHCSFSHPCEIPTKSWKWSLWERMAAGVGAVDGRCVCVRVCGRAWAGVLEGVPAGCHRRDSRRSGFRQAWQSWKTRRSGRCRADGQTLASASNELEKRKNIGNRFQLLLLLCHWYITTSFFLNIEIYLLAQEVHKHIDRHV